MDKIIGIHINNNSKLCFCRLKNQNLKKGITIIVKDDKTMYFAKVVSENIKNNKDDLVYEFVRIASKKDYQIFKKNEIDAKKAIIKCRKIIVKYNLNMKIISAEFSFNRSHLFFSFISDSRIDFRDLVKDLADIYKTRIELKQIGVRDKAKEVGGCGQCGRALCCAKFMNDFDSISINMAKNQNLSLNPNKINGVCGRLLCCLKYEDECYKKCRKGLPSLGSTIEVADGKGRVVAVDILKRTYKVDIPEKGCIEYKVEDESN